MGFYGSPPVGVIVRGHFHNYDNLGDWSLGSGMALAYQESIPLNLSVVVCDYCGNRYLIEEFKKNNKCLGCGAVKFHFEG